MLSFNEQNSTHTNLCALEYGCKITPLMQQLSQPLLSYGITIFTYSRIFKNGKRLYLCTNSDWLEHYICNSYEDELDHLKHYIPKDDMKMSFWDGFATDKVFSALYHKFDFWHGFSIYEKHNDYIDYFDFASHKNNHHINKFYLNNFVLLELFTQYFKEKISYLMDSIDQHHLIVPKKWVSFEEVHTTPPLDTENGISSSMGKSNGTSSLKDNFSSLNKASDLQRFKVQKIEKKFEKKLTQKEIIIALLIAKGKSIKEISLYLGIPPKVSANHLIELKEKIKAKTSKDIIKFYEQIIAPPNTYIGAHRGFSVQNYNRVFEHPFNLY